MVAALKAIAAPRRRRILSLVRDRELSAVVDNPVVFSDGSVESTGNFHGEPLAFALVGLTTVLLGWMAYPAVPAYFVRGSMSLAVSLWQSRVLDVWIQIALIFSGVMGVLGLLSEKTPGRSQEIHQ